MQRKWKRRWQRLAQVILPVAASGLILVSAYNPVYANPAGGTVTAGSAAIAANGTTTTISQTTDKASINWQSFNIAAGEKVQFVQPSASSVALNRVVGNDASAIYGTLSANGRVYLINPNGILFAPGAQVNVGGLVASTLNISDSDFIQGRYTFSGTGAGSVVNQGSLTVSGEVVLLGTAVKNEGLITAKVAGLMAGNKVTLDFSGDNLVNLTVDTGAAGGSAANSGSIKSAGGLVVMSAGTKDVLLNTVVNNSGVIRAQSLANVNGVIRMEGGLAVNSGTLDASGKGAGQTGGTVKVLGDAVTLAQGTTINVSGDAGGGTALIGGTYQGGSSEYAATKTTVETGAGINADALTTGNGGNVVVWANDTTRFAGSISAQGGAVSGKGGNVETSGKKTLLLSNSANVNTLAANGVTGNWLLDPTDFTIGTGATGANYWNNSELGARLDTTGITIQTDNSSGTEAGDINVNAVIKWTSNSTLDLSAYNNININAPITGTNGSLDLKAANGLVYTSSAIKINNLTLDKDNLFTRSGGSVKLTDTSNSVLTINSQVYTLIDGFSTIGSSGYYALNDDPVLVTTIVPSFSGIFNGLGHVANTNITGNDFTGLFGKLSGTVKNLGVTGSVNGNGYFTGAIAGIASKEIQQGISISGQGTILNCYNAATVTGPYSIANNSFNAYVGGIVGLGGIVKYCYNIGTVTSNVGLIGGIAGGVGINSDSGSILYCYNNGTVSSISTGSNQIYVGGIVGVLGIYDTPSTVSYCYNTGNISGRGNNILKVGGIVASNWCTVQDTYNNGNVTGHGSVPSTTYIGALVGTNMGGAATVMDSYWNMETLGCGVGVGNAGNPTVYGVTTTQMQQSGTYFGWNITNTGGSTAAIWRIYEGQSTPLLRSFLTPVNVISVSKTYDGQTSGTVDSSDYTLSVMSASLSGSLSYTTSSKNTGSYSTSAGSLSLSGLYSNQQGYDISYIPAALTISPAALTITAADASKTYGESATLSGYIVNGLVSNDNVSSVGLNSTGAAATANKGDYAIEASGASGVGLGNYTISYANGTLTVSSAVLTITASDASKTYGQTADINGYSISGLLNSDSVSGVTLSSAGTAATVNKGDYAITASNASGTGLGNYTVNYVDGTLSVNPAALTITASDASKTYGQTASLSGYSVSGLLNNDSVSGVALNSAGTAATAGKGVYAITGGNASGTGLENYTITYNPGTLSVSPASLTIKANDVSKYFGSSNPVLSYNTSGLVSGDALSDIIRGLSLTTTATSSSQPGTYTIHPIGDLISANYMVNWQNGTLTVLDAPWQNQAYYGALVHADKMAQRVYNQAMIPLVSTPVDFLPITIIQQGINLDGIKKFASDSQR